MFLKMPAGWKTPKADDFEEAKGHALAALAHKELNRYYEKSKNYAGTTFWKLGNNPWDDVVVDDLLAVTLLSVQVGPRGIRALTDDGDHRRAVLDAIASVHPSRTLAGATSQDLLDAWQFHVAVKEAISNPQATKANPWVTASKVTARKRPSLIPVRDNVVGKLLGPNALKYAGVYWQLMRALLRDTEVIDAMGAARARVADEVSGDLQTGFDAEPDLRLLDAALWIYAVDRSRTEDPATSSDT